MPQLNSGDITVDYAQEERIASEMLAILKEAKQASGYDKPLHIEVVEGVSDFEVIANVSARRLLISERFIKACGFDLPERRRYAVSVIIHEIAHLERGSFIIAAHKMQKYMNKAVAAGIKFLAPAIYATEPLTQPEVSVYKQFKDIAQFVVAVLHNSYARYEEFKADDRVKETGYKKELKLYLESNSFLYFIDDKDLYQRVVDGESPSRLHQELDKEASWVEKCLRIHPHNADRIKRLERPSVGKVR